MEPSSQTEGIIPESPWLIYCDGAWGNAGVGAAVVLISPSKIKSCFIARLQFTNEANKCTNNIAEYKAILLGLRKLRAIRIQTCTLCSDSKVVASQIEKQCITREPTLERYLSLIRRMENHFKGFTVEYSERNKNSEAGELAKATALNMPLPIDVFFQVAPDTSIEIVEMEPRVINLIESKDWRAPVMAYSAIITSQATPKNTSECSGEPRHIK
jgi:ribonuclease HI